MEIHSCAIAGAGALGTMYAREITRRLGKESVVIITDPARKEKYEKEGVLANGEPCDFLYDDGMSAGNPVDLIIFAVKYGGLARAIREAAHLVGPDTIFLSVLNGITSEDQLAEAFGDRNVLLCAALGMDATRRGNNTMYQHAGSLWFGARREGQDAACQAVAAFFLRAGIDFELAEDMPLRLWRKLMMNVGINQATAVFETGYGGVKHPGEARDVMVAAMEETRAVAVAEGIPLTEDDITFWLDVTNRFADEGMPSMRQDLLAGRPTEVDLFAGTIRQLGDKHGIPTPVNDLLYQLIREKENRCQVSGVR